MSRATLRPLPCDERGYIDPIMSVLPIAALLVWFAHPMLIGFVATEPLTGLLGWLRVVVAVLILAFVQVLAAVVCVAEAHHDAKCGGVRSGLNRAPALQGLSAPIALAVVYLIGLWPLLRLEPRPVWALLLNGVLALGIVIAGLLAHGKGQAHE